MSFYDSGLEPVLVQSLKRCGFVAPTEIQRQCITAVLKGHDVLALSKTGTGKTLAYLLPLIQSLSRDAVTSSPLPPWMGVILVPTKELILQVQTQLMQLITSGSLGISVTTFMKHFPTRGQIGSIVICTPRQLVTQLNVKTTPSAPGSGWINNFKTLIIDEADLLLSYGYDGDMHHISESIPRSCQCVLASATRSSDLEAIVKLVMENPITIDLLGRNQRARISETVSHYYLECAPEDKAVHLLVLLQFQSIAKPVLIFVNNIKSGYRFRLFLECFKIRSSLLHRELPQNTRQQLIQDFNKGNHDIMIVVDDLQSAFLREGAEKREGKKKPKEAEFGVARGLDFKGVKTVINIEPPQTANGYIHRVGRTGRAGNFGMALTLLTPADIAIRDAVCSHLRELHPDGGCAEVFKPFLQFRKQHVAALKYRATDVMRSMSRRTIEAERKSDLRQEIFRAKEMGTYFESHPEEKRLLEKTYPQAALSQKRKFANVSHLPSYIAPTTSPAEERHRRQRTPKTDPLTLKVGGMKKRRRGASN